jgi:hypothetical protein
VFAFRRQTGKDAVTVAVNLSREPREYQGAKLAPWGWSAR